MYLNWSNMGERMMTIVNALMTRLQPVEHSSGHLALRNRVCKVFNLHYSFHTSCGINMENRCPATFHSWLSIHVYHKEAIFLMIPTKYSEAVLDIYLSHCDVRHNILLLARPPKNLWIFYTITI